MNFNQTKTLFVLLFIFGAISSKAQDSFRIYSVLRGPRLFVTNYDVDRFITVSTLSDQALISLFKANNRDYNAYSQALAKYSRERRKDAVKKLGYIKLIEIYATRNQDPSKWRAFRVTEKDYSRRIETFENKALKDLLDQGKGIVFAREEFGRRLKEAGFPHYASLSNTDLYFDWFKLQKERLKLDFHLKEVSRFEYSIAGNSNSNQRHFVPSRENQVFIDEVGAKALEHFNKARLNSAQAREIIAKDPRLSIMIKELGFIGPDSTNIATLKREAPAVYKDFMNTIENEVLVSLESTVVSDVIRYEGLARQFATQYTSSELALKAQENQNLFVSNKGDHNNLMLSKLYQLAQALGSENKDQVSLEKYAKDATLKAAKLLSDKTFVESAEAGALRLEDWLLQGLKNELKSEKNQENSAYQSQFESMVRWVIKFQVKKAARATRPETKISLHDEKDWETRKRVEAYLEKVKFDNKLLSFKQNQLLDHFTGTVTLNLTGDSEETAREALELLIK